MKTRGKIVSGVIGGFVVGYLVGETRAMMLMNNRLRSRKDVIAKVMSDAILKVLNGESTIDEFNDDLDEGLEFLNLINRI